jgi:hypothetical protein
MQEEKIFTYTALAKKRGDAGMVKAFMIMALFEAVLVLLLVQVLVHDETIRLIIEILHTGLCVSAVIMLVNGLSVFKTSHSLTPTHLRLHYGRRFKLDLPLNLLASSWKAQQKPKPGFNLKPLYDRTNRRVCIAYGEQGQVLLKLHRPYPMRLGFFKKVEAEQILFNVDQREEFFAALDALLLPDKAALAEQRPLSNLTVA